MSEIRQWYEKQPGICVICNHSMNIYEDCEEIGLDHKLPVSRNGSPGLNNCNLVHKECNQIKGDFTLEELHCMIKCFDNANLKYFKTRLKRASLIFRR